MNKAGFEEVNQPDDRPLIVHKQIDSLADGSDVWCIDWNAEVFHRPAIRSTLKSVFEVYAHGEQTHSSLVSEVRQFEQWFRGSRRLHTKHPSDKRIQRPYARGNEIGFVVRALQENVRAAD